MRPTTLRLLEENCPRAVQHYEAGMPQDVMRFGVGLAAHAVIESLGLARPETPEEADAVAAERVRGLIADGPGGPDGGPPIPPRMALDGRDLAMRYWRRHGHGSVLAQHEAGLALGWDRRPMRYRDADAMLRCRTDLVDVEGDATWIVRDYKTSWQIGADDLGSVQMRAQAALLWADRDRWISEHGYPTPREIRREIANLRTGEIFSRVVVLDEAGIEEMERMLSDLETICSAALRVLASGRAAPGARCHGCPYAARCEDARAYIDGDEPAAARYAVALARAKALEADARAETAEAPVEIHGGVVGWREESSRIPRAGWLPALWEEITGSPPGAIAGILDALGGSVSAIDNVGKVLHAGRGAKAARDQWIAEQTETKVGRRWGVQTTERSTEDGQ